jgi:hypothetical protein
VSADKPVVEVEEEVRQGGNTFNVTPITRHDMYFLHQNPSEIFYTEWLFALYCLLSLIDPYVFLYPMQYICSKLLKAEIYYSRYQAIPDAKR